MDDPSTTLAAMAYRDLDAALQLLAERAQYLAGADGAMIALRRGDHNDMLCRASAGSSAPELGALLSMENGFSGESVRTRQVLRCDDAQQDSRVNRENCRRLGISSVVAMPIVSNQQVLGVFELFSSKPHAFSDDNVAALRRLSEMVETAVKYAVLAQPVPPAQDQPAVEKLEAPADEIKIEVETPLSSEDILETSDALSTAGKDSPIENRSISEPDVLLTGDVLLTEDEKVEPPAPPEPALKKPLFWSAATHSSENRVSTPDAAPSVLPVLRNLHKCKACGFPVSEGRVYCVECEDKQWRGRKL
jgi:transcriptional regulator with GAF, ATPase, and Fis domain